MIYLYLLITIFSIFTIAMLAFLFYERQQLHELLSNLDLLYKNDNLPWHSLNVFILPEHKELVNKFAQHYRKMEKLQLEHKQAVQDEKNLIASIAHDFQTPITTILGTIELLEKDNISSSIDEQKLSASLSLLKERTLSLSNQVKSFYLYSVIDSGDKPANIKAINLFDIVAKEIAARANDIQAKFKEHVNISLSEDLPLLQQDELGCTRIVANLLKNCLEHGEEELNINLKGNFDQQVLVFSNVWFNPGISDLELICKRSYRADSAHSQIHSDAHAGLGMSIVHDLAKKLQIKLNIYEENWPESTPNNSSIDSFKPHKAKLCIKLTFSDYKEDKRKDELEV